MKKRMGLGLIWAVVVSSIVVSVSGTGIASGINQVSQFDAGAEHTLAIKTDGTLWAWGNNNVGQLGLGDALQRSSPVQVGTATNWRKVSAGGAHTLAIRTDGTLWAWGGGWSGQLGLGHTFSPLEVTAMRPILPILPGGVDTMAVVAASSPPLPMAHLWQKR